MISRRSLFAAAGALAGALGIRKVEADHAEEHAVYLERDHQIFFQGAAVAPAAEDWIVVIAMQDARAGTLLDVMVQGAWPPPKEGEPCLKGLAQASHDVKRGDVLIVGAPAPYHPFTRLVGEKEGREKRYMFVSEETAFNWRSA